MIEKKKLIFIAEIGLNHNGNFGLIYELVKQAALSGADIIKFQLGWRSKPGEINSLTKNEIEHILQCCERFSTEPMFSIFNNEALEMLKNIKMNYYKIASRTIKDEIDLCQRIINLNQTTFISLGMWDKETLPFGNKSNIKYLWCKSKYPAYPWDLNNFPKNFTSEGICGYSDHSVGTAAATMAYFRGASILEKHYTHNINAQNNCEKAHMCSFTPESLYQFKNLIQDLKIING